MPIFIDKVSYFQLPWRKSNKDIKLYTVQLKRTLILFWGRRAPQTLVGQGPLIQEICRSHTHDTPHSVGLLWAIDRPVSETSTCTTHNTHNIYPCPPGGIRSRSLSWWTTADLRLRPRSHRDLIIGQISESVTQIAVREYDVWWTQETSSVGLPTE